MKRIGWKVWVIGAAFLMVVSVTGLFAVPMHVGSKCVGARWTVGYEWISTASARSVNSNRGSRAASPMHVLYRRRSKSAPSSFAPRGDVAFCISEGQRCARRRSPWGRVSTPSCAGRRSPDHPDHDSQSPKYSRSAPSTSNGSWTSISINAATSAAVIDMPLL